jgi:hypothetical protein
VLVELPQYRYLTYTRHGMAWPDLVWHAELPVHVRSVDIENCWLLHADSATVGAADMSVVSRFSGLAIP